MTMFVFGAAKAPIPDGSYHATFTAVEPSEAKEWQGQMLGPGLRWRFTISTGPHKGATAQRITGQHPSPINGCGKMLISLLGRTPSKDESVDISKCVGNAYLIVMQGGRIESVALPPQQ